MIKKMLLTYNILKITRNNGGHLFWWFDSRCGCDWLWVRCTF